MKNVMGLIYHTNEQIDNEITRHRCLAAMPFAGRYRLIDFALSNMVNAGLTNIGVFTSFKLRSLIDHLGKGKEWGLDRKKDGLFILPTKDKEQASHLPIVNLEDFIVNADYLKRSKQKYVLITSGNLIYNIDYKKVLTQHDQMKNDLTVLYKENYQFLAEEKGPYLFIKTDQNGKVIDMAVYPFLPETKVVMNNFIMEKELLLHFLNKAQAKGEWDLIKLIKASLHELKVGTFPYPGYLAIIQSLLSYYHYQMDLLRPEILNKLFFENGLIYTKMKDGPPSKYFNSAEVNNALVANGCLIEGKVENSILFKNVRVGKGTLIRNSIIMQSSFIEDEVYLDRVILDKNVHIRKGAMLMGEMDNPVLVEKRSLI